MTNEIAPLNSLLRDELAAVDSYRRAMARVRDPDAREELATALEAHAHRAEALRDRVKALGGKPAASPGPLGALFAIVEGAASLVSERATVALLEEEENRGLSRYRSEMPRLDPESHRLVLEHLLPEQEQTYYAVATLRMALH